MLRHILRSKNDWLRNLAWCLFFYSIWRKKTTTQDSSLDSLTLKLPNGASIYFSAHKCQVRLSDKSSSFVDRDQASSSEPPSGRINIVEKRKKVNINISMKSHQITQTHFVIQACAPESEAADKKNEHAIENWWPNEDFLGLQSVCNTARAKWKSETTIKVFWKVDLMFYQEASLTNFSLLPRHVDFVGDANDYRSVFQSCWLWFLSSGSNTIKIRKQG